VCNGYDVSLCNGCDIYDCVSLSMSVVKCICVHSISRGSRGEAVIIVVVVVVVAAKVSSYL
jgi:hypothetical protein